MHTKPPADTDIARNGALPKPEGAPASSEGSAVIPVFRPSITEEEIEAVAATLRSYWLGPGPRTAEFEGAFAAACGSAHAVSVSSGTAALLAALSVLDIGPGDEVILPSFTYVSAFQMIASLGAKAVFADVEASSLTLDADDVRRRITPRTRAIIAVHHGGHLADIERLTAIAEQAGVVLIDDAAHACGAQYRGRPVGSLCRMTCFSFNVVKNLCSGDGGMVTTSDAQLANELRNFRSLGLDQDTFSRYGPGSERQSKRWEYQIVRLGHRVHMNDIAASLGLVQLRRLRELNARRAAIVARYEEAFAGLPGFSSIQPRPDTLPSFHMYTVLMDRRDAFIEAMKEKKISIGVHYSPLHQYSITGSEPSPLPVTERVARQVTTFPLYPDMTNDECSRVIAATKESFVRAIATGA